MKLCVIGGAGYVGLTTAVGFAQLGHQVVAVDKDRERLAMLRQGISPIHGEGIEAALRTALHSTRLCFSAELADGLQDAGVVFVAVGSPQHPDGTADISQLCHVAELLGESLDHDVVVAIKSTIPVGAVHTFSTILASRGGLHQADVVVVPEFLREGHQLEDFFFPTRIVIGADSERARTVMRRLYSPFVAQQGAVLSPVPMAKNVPLVETSIESAQMIKYAANAFLAARVAFINEIAAVCEHTGADVADVVKGLGYDPRIGHDYLQPGIGFGGPCLEKDLHALIQFSSRQGYDATFLRAVAQSNDRQVTRIVKKTKELFGGGISGVRLGVLGLAFKPGTNEVRSSLSLRIADLLHREGAEIVAHDPTAISESKKVMPQFCYNQDVYEALAGADALVLLTDWPQYASLDFARVASVMRQRNVMDGRNTLPSEHLRRLGFRYVSIGRQPRD